MDGVGEDEVIVRLCIERVLQAGTEDWICDSWVAGVAQEAAQTAAEDAIRDLSIRVIRDLVEHQLMDLGQVEAGSGFRKWGVSTSAGVERVEREWRALGRSPWPGEICWLNRTAEGDLQAAKLTRGTE